MRKVFSGGRHPVSEALRPGEPDWVDRHVTVSTDDQELADEVKGAIREILAEPAAPSNLRRVIIDPDYTPPPLTPERLSRIRDMTAEDKRRVRLHDTPDPALTMVEPTVDPETVRWHETRDGHRGLQHLDGRGEGRPPRRWEDDNSHDRYWTFAGEREDLTSEIRRERAQLRLPENLALLMAELTAVMHPRAQQRRETDARSGLAPDHAPTMEDGIGQAKADEIERRLLIIRLETEACWDILDQHRGLAFKSYALMDTEEKDALITGPDFRGLHVREVTALHPELGAEQTLRRVRALAGQDAYGHPKREKEET